jgi:hypothetical protein
MTVLPASVAVTGRNVSPPKISESNHARSAKCIELTKPSVAQAPYPARDVAEAEAGLVGCAENAILIVLRRAERRNDTFDEGS